jgi:hypothetical protein
VLRRGIHEVPTHPTLPALPLGASTIDDLILGLKEQCHEQSIRAELEPLRVA